MKIKTILFLFGFCLASCLPNSQKASVPTVQVEAVSNRPNIIFILADDMETTALEFMPQTIELLGGNGAIFTRFYVNNSLCCPSRATILRGQYMHNTSITGNKLPTGGFDTFNQLGLEDNAFPVWLQQAGYNTALFGKYLRPYP